ALAISQTPPAPEPVLGGHAPPGAGPLGVSVKRRSPGSFPGNMELTGSTNLITHYNLEHSYNKFCGKKVKEKLSNFLPDLPGMIDLPGSHDNSSLRSLIEKPPICSSSFNPITGTMLTGFRLHAGPLPEQCRLMHIQPPKKKNKHKHKQSRTQDPVPPETPSDSDHKKKKKKKEEDPERKRKKKEKKKKKVGGSKGEELLVHFPTSLATLMLLGRDRTWNVSNPSWLSPCSGASVLM
uniref:Mediator of RNA polymerase II transcription subunit 19 n=1 Tax=Chelonoidis abingdonii TaxID=106734 RepID=A0A8C0QQ97_CHEAB